jgi:hypothetical protein
LLLSSAYLQANGEKYMLEKNNSFPYFIRHTDSPVRQSLHLSLEKRKSDVSCRIIQGGERHNPAGLDVQAEGGSPGPGGDRLVPPVLGRDGVHGRGPREPLLSIGGGADEIMLAIVCKYMGTLSAPPKGK